MLENKDIVDIRSLTLREPSKKTGLIDPASYFTNNDWDLARGMWENGDEFGKRQFLLSIQILNPTLFKNMGLPKNKLDIAKRVVVSQVENLRLRKADQVAANLVDYKLVDPDGFKSLDLDHTIFENLFAGLKSQIIDPDVDPAVLDTPGKALALAVLFPQFKDEIQKDSVFRDNVVNNSLGRALLEMEWDAYVRSAAVVRAAFPKDYEILDASFEDRLERNVNIQEDLFHHESFMDQLNNAAHLRILLAEEVHLTDHGIVLQMPGENLAEREASLPVIRRF